MVRTLVAPRRAGPREERLRSLLSVSSRGALLLVMVCALPFVACKRKSDPYEHRPRPAMTASEITDGEVAPPTSAEGPEVERAKVTMTALRAVVGFWRLEQGGRTRCPTLRDLAAAPSSGFDPNTMTLDPWGRPFEVDCLQGIVRLRSLGPDRQPNTPDDIIRF